MKPYLSYPDEQWKTVEDAPDYLVSNYGRVWSNRRRGEYLIPCNNNSAGYYRVRLTANGERDYNVSRLVAKAFIPNPENKPEVNHKDGRKVNNRDINLEWITHRDNIKHAFKSGLKYGLKGERNPNVKLTSDDVRIIIDRLAAHPGRSSIVPMLAKEYGVSISLIYRLRYGTAWRHIK